MESQTQAFLIQGCIIVDWFSRISNSCKQTVSNCARLRNIREIFPLIHLNVHLVRI